MGASFDSVEEQKAFAEQEGFPYRLLADTDKSVGLAYGVEAPSDNKFPDWPLRVTFLFDPAGMIAKVYDFSDQPYLSEHAQVVLADINELS